MGGEFASGKLQVASGKLSLVSAITKKTVEAMGSGWLVRGSAAAVGVTCLMKWCCAAAQLVICLMK